MPSSKGKWFGRRNDHESIVIQVDKPLDKIDGEEHDEK
jgi:hypothetical protein